MTSAGEEGLELTRWGTLFVRRDVEAAYRLWQVEHDLALNRAANLLAVLVWGFMVPGFAWIAVAGWPAWFAAGIGCVVLLLVFRAVLYAKSLRSWMPAVGVPVAVLCAVIGIAAAHWHMHLHSLGVAALAMNALFDAIFLRFRPVFVLAMVIPTAAVEGASLVYFHRNGEITSTELTIDLLVAGIVLGTAIFASVSLDRAGRLAFRQERIIEGQKARIERAESLLKQELGHQVAARSRELGRMLASATIVPGRPKVGDRFDARYRIERELGAGAMGAVFEVVRATDDARLALKIVTGEVSADRAARFAREAEIGARVRHPNLVEIVDVGVASGGVPYLAMELAPHGSLEERRERFGDAAWARPILRGIAGGLVALHEAGVVHRDLKPANVLITEDDVPKISDFGISRFGELEVDAAAATLAKPQALTATGMLLGTPYYMAPEAVRGAKVEAPADVFAFGILAVEMLTGRAPFSTPPMFRVLAGEPLEAPSVGLSGPLGDALRGCLAEDPASRPAMRAVRDAITRGSAGSP